MSQKFYSIIAGRKEPAKVLQGTINKTTGLPNANAQKIMMPVGKIMIPNYSHAWAKRIAEGKKAADGKVAVTDPLYKGRLEFLEFGDSDGESVEIRFLPNSSSLDKQYQDNVQKLKPSDDDSFIILEQGINNYDYESQSLKIEMIKHHALMLENNSKDPELTEYEIATYDSERRNKSKVQRILLKNTAEGYILDAAPDPARVKILASIFRIEGKLQDDVIIERLLDIATDNPEQVVDTMQRLQANTHIMLTDALGEGVVELEGDNMFVVNETKKELVLSDIEGKGKDQLLWLTKAMIEEPRVWDAVHKADVALKAYRKQLV